MSETLNPVLMEQLQALRQQLPSTGLSRPKARYVGLLLKQAESKLQNKAGVYFLNKAEKLLAQGQKSTSPKIKKTRTLSQPLQDWNKEKIRRVKKTLQNSGRGISNLEKAQGLQWMQRFEDKLSESKTTNRNIDRTHNTDLTDFRSRLYTRLLRHRMVALRAVSKTKQAKMGTNKTHLPEQVVGPYNDRWNLKDFFNTLKGQDPFWVAEFQALYQELLQMQTALVIPK